MVWCTVTWVVSLGGGTFWPPSGTHWSSGTPSDTHWSAYFTPSPNLVTFFVFCYTLDTQWHTLICIFLVVTKPSFFSLPSQIMEPKCRCWIQNLLIHMYVASCIFTMYSVQLLGCKMYTAMGTFETISTCQLENVNSGLLGWRQDISQFANLVWAFFWLLFVVVVFNSGGCGAC